MLSRDHLEKLKKERERLILLLVFESGEIICRKERKKKTSSEWVHRQAKDNRRRQRNNITAGTGDKAGVTWRRGGEGGRDKRTWNEQSAITICHAGKRCDAGRAVIKYKRCARRLRNSVALIMRFARHACERNGIRPFPDTFATYSHLLSDPYVLSLPLSLERLKSLQR